MDLQHRKARAGLQILEPNGVPAAHKELAIDQVSHQFLFGCGAFDAVALNVVPDEKVRTAISQRFDKWFRLFNYGTIPFYWGRYEAEEGKPAFRETMAGAKYLRQRGVRVKGHPLCWHTACAPWLMKYSNEEILDRQLRRIDRDVSAYRGVVDMWDVINEVVIMPVFDKYDNAITRICREKGRFQLVKKVFEAAKQANPDAVLLINDFNTSPAYEILIEGLLDMCVPIDVIGIQSHQHQGYWGRDKLCEVLERFSRFGLPMHFTENTLISGDLMPPHIVDLNDWQVKDWPTTPEGEARQAKEVSEMYSILFNHPLVEAITSWDFIDGCWLGAPSGLIRRDGSEKPAYEALDRLIHTEWETHETILTDAQGFVSFVGFRGDYRLSMEGRSSTLRLNNDINTQITLL